MSREEDNLEFTRKMAREIIGNAPANWQEIVRKNLQPDDDLFGGLTPFEWESIELYVERIAPIVMQRMEAAFDGDSIIARCEHCGRWFVGPEKGLDERFEQHHNEKHREECRSRTMPVGKSGMRIPITPPDPVKVSLN